MAGAATLGRLILATFARSLVRARLMRESDRQNIDVVRAWLEKHKTVTVSAFFLFMKLDWKMLVEQRKLVRRRPLKPHGHVEHGHTTKR